MNGFYGWIETTITTLVVPFMDQFQIGALVFSIIAASVLLMVLGRVLKG